jgi:hypothetical protein
MSKARARTNIQAVVGECALIFVEVFSALAA